MARVNSTKSRFNPWLLLLAVPFIALLWVPFFNSIEPKLWGIPFFYWYQFLWVFLTSGIILYVLHFAPGSVGDRESVEGALGRDAAKGSGRSKS